MVRQQRKVNFQNKTTLTDSEDDSQTVEIISNAQILPPITIPNTQDVIAELGLAMDTSSQEAVSKAQILEKELETGSITNFLYIMELLWETNFLVQILPALKNIERFCIKKRNIVWKKIITTIISAMLITMKKLKQEKVELKNCSYEVFKNAALKGELSTMFTKMLDQDLMNEIIESYTKNTEVPSSSSVNMMTTTTSSTIVPTPIIPVNVPALTVLNPVEPSGLDFLDELLPLTNIPCNTGYIQQSILRRKGDSSVTWTSPGETGYQVI